jgi:hypothetical protein
MTNGWNESAAVWIAHIEERAVWAEWDGIRVQNWHRPLSAYMSVFLNLGTRLRHFAEPAPADPTTPKAQKFVRAPWFVMMEWEEAGQNPQPKQPMPTPVQGKSWPLRLTCMTRARESV